MDRKTGTRTITFKNPPSIAAYASIAGKMEGEGPLSQYFDKTNDDITFGEKSWEKSESRMQNDVVNLALKKANMTPNSIDILFGGDLLNQCIGSTFGLLDFEIPFLGLYGACSTMAEGLILSAAMVDGGFAKNAIAVTSSHFCSAERQYRFPLDYGGQRTPTAQWTVTGAGAAVVTGNDSPIKITRACIGKIVDMGILDANNMGAAMAPAAADTLIAFLKDTNTTPSDYNLILTGDLGTMGRSMTRDLMSGEGYNLDENYTDCGILIYNDKQQDVHAGGSGCGCSASVLNGYILSEMEKGRWDKIVFVGTGALMSTVSTMQGESIPSIAHLVCIEKRD